MTDTWRVKRSIIIIIIIMSIFNIVLLTLRFTIQTEFSADSKSVYPRGRYASAVLATAVCLSVGVCHKSEFYQKGQNDSNWFWHGGFFHPSYGTVL